MKKINLLRVIFSVLIINANSYSSGFFETGLKIAVTKESLKTQSFKGTIDPLYKNTNLSPGAFSTTHPFMLHLGPLMIFTSASPDSSPLSKALYNELQKNRSVHNAQFTYDSDKLRYEDDLEMYERNLKSYNAEYANWQKRMAAKKSSPQPSLKSGRKVPTYIDYAPRKPAYPQPRDSLKGGRPSFPDAIFDNTLISFEIQGPTDDLKNILARVVFHNENFGRFTQNQHDEDPNDIVLFLTLELVNCDGISYENPQFTPANDSQYLNSLYEYMIEHNIDQEITQSCKLRTVSYELDNTLKGQAPSALAEFILDPRFKNSSLIPTLALNNPDKTFLGNTGGYLDVFITAKNDVVLSSQANFGDSGLYQTYSNASRLVLNSQSKSEATPKVDEKFLEASTVYFNGLRDYVSEVIIASNEPELVSARVRDYMNNNGAQFSEMLGAWNFIKRELKNQPLPYIVNHIAKTRVILDVLRRVENSQKLYGTLERTLEKMGRIKLQQTDPNFHDFTGEN